MYARAQDDKEIHWDGVESLDDQELREACKMRGIRTRSKDGKRFVGVSVLRPLLKEWISLANQNDIPVSFLIFSRAFAFTKDSKLQLEEDSKKLEAAVASLPDTTVDSLIVEEGEDISRERKLQIITDQEKLINEEAAEAREQEAADQAEKEKEKEEEKEKEAEERKRFDKEAAAEAAAAERTLAGEARYRPPTCNIIPLGLSMILHAQSACRSGCGSSQGGAGSRTGGGRL
jgi:LETM1 and EF-hand domain-containing protein 1